MEVRMRKSNGPPQWPAPATSSRPEPAVRDNDSPKTTRRAFIRATGALVGSSAAVLASHAAAQGSAGTTAGPSPGSGGNVPPAVPEWMKVPGAPVGGKLYGVPSKYEAHVVRNVPKNAAQYLSASSRSPLGDLDGIVTPNGLYYERHHGGVPDIDPAQHRLMIHGMVRKPLIFTVDELRRLPSVSQFHFLECSGNPVYTKPYGKTASDLVGLVSCGEWTGVSLRLLLEEAGVAPEAKWVLAEGADSAALTRSIPIEKCLDDALIVYSQNGERLRPEQGYPLRLLVPGFEGNMNVKWLRRLKPMAGPAFSREETSKYTDLLPSGKAREFTFYMEAKSIITTPSGGQRVESPGFVEIRGIAWSGHGRIRRVDVSVDGGRRWREAALQAPVMTRCLTRFRHAWHWDGQPTVIMSRAVDETGYVQPTFEQLVAERGVHSFYHNNAIQPWRVASSGEVSNANA
jgi:sulfane dehydrogenase subunit SoxC